MIDAETGLRHSEDGGRDSQARKHKWPLKKKGKQKNKQILRKRVFRAFRTEETECILP